ncbi:SsrA-binding protein [Flavobacteriales bacterium]|nr:SsrA-binding protein [Flavobacteriales bacterium]
MKQNFFKIMASLNNLLLPSFTKQRLDLAKAPKWKLAIVAWRYYVTKQSLD